MYDFITPRRSGIAVASTVALFISGCDGVGPSVKDKSGTAGDPPDTRFSYREDGVVLSKSASIELADFVGAVQLDAVFPMSARINSLDSEVRRGAFKRLFAAQREVESAMQGVESAGDDVQPDDLNRLEQANQNIERILRSFLGHGASGRVQDRARALVEKYPFLRGRTADEIESILWMAFGQVGKDDTGSSRWIPTAAAADTGQGDTCNVDCAVSAGFKFASVELAFAAATTGCIATTVGVLACMGWAFAAKYLALGYLTWGVYTCTKSCT